MKRIFLGLSSGILFSTLALAQQPSGPPKVTAVPIPTVTVKQGASAPVRLMFRIAPGYHINSNKPTEETLLPTIVHFDVPTDVSLAKVSYPEGELKSFPFDPTEKLSVYSGDITVKALVNSARTTPKGRYRVHGTLRYQACDNRACYPPSRLPIAFDVQVLKSQVAMGGRRNPAQSPHVHQ